MRKAGIGGRARLAGELREMDAEARRMHSLLCVAWVHEV